MIKLKHILLEYKVGEWRKNDPNIGWYRISGKYDVFGQIKKVSNRQWEAEIRYKSGQLKQYAGIWKTFKTAKEEIEHSLKFMDEL